MGGSMKKISVLILMVLFIGIFQSNLFSIIYSRVQGVVLDKETNQPLDKVDVTLWNYKKFDSFAARKTISDQNGKFIFDNIPYAEYFIMCEKGDYQTISPFHFYAADPDTDLNVFYLGEGKIKHFIMKMERGGKLKVNILKKNENGISGFEGVTVSLLKKRKNAENFQSKFNTYASFKTDKNGVFLVEGLKPGDDYNISIQPTNINIGLPYFEKQIEIKKNETTEFTKNYDFTDKTGVSGKITLNKGTFDRVDLYLVNLNIKFEYSYLLVDGDGIYSFLNIQPGEYKMIFNLSDDQNQSFRKETIVKIEINNQKICNVNF